MIKKPNMLVSSLLLTALLAFGAVTVRGASDSNSGILSLDDVIQKTESGNSTLSLYNKKIDVSIAAAEAAKLAKQDETEYQKEMRLNVNPDRRLLELDNLKREKTDKENDAVIASKQYFYQYLIQDDLIKVQNYKIQRLKQALEDKKLEIKVGTKAETSLI